MERPENPQAAQELSSQAPRSRASGGNDRPWHNRITPPPPSLPGQRSGGVELRVGKRLLWVGSAAYPLRNITRVYTFLLVPRRGEATVLFFKRVAIILSVALAVTVVSWAATLDGDDGIAGTVIGVVWFGAAVALIYCVGDLGAVLTAASHWVMAIETSGASTALVTSENTQHLDQLVDYVVNAIENPETEFKVKVGTLSINPRHYHFGDNVNMYGGSGNVGMEKA